MRKQFWLAGIWVALALSAQAQDAPRTAFDLYDRMQLGFLNPPPAPINPADLRQDFLSRPSTEWAPAGCPNLGVLLKNYNRFARRQLPASQVPELGYCLGARSWNVRSVLADYQPRSGLTKARDVVGRQKDPFGTKAAESVAGGQGAGAGASAKLARGQKAAAQQQSNPKEEAAHFPDPEKVNDCSAPFESWTGIIA